MAKSTPSKAGIQFEIPDEFFDEEGPESDSKAVEEPEAIQTAAEEEDASEEKPEPKEKKPKVKAAQEEEEEDDGIPDPTTEEPRDQSAYILAELRAQNAELMARLQGLEQRPVAKEVDKEEQELASLQEKKKALRALAKAALEEGDEVKRQEAVWELSDVEQEILKLDADRQMSRYRQQPAAQEQRSGLSRQQLDAMQAETFLRINNVSREEQRRMEAAWEAIVAKKPSWNAPEVPVWRRMEVALGMARKTNQEGRRGSLVEGGQYTPQSSRQAASALPKAAREVAARAFGMSVKDYDKMIKDFGSQKGSR